MDGRQIEALLQNLKSLGTARLSALGAIGAFVFAVISIGSFFATRSTFEVLYVGLTQQDISRMSAVLAEADIPFESSSDGTKLSVGIGSVPQARALLAEKGLPGSPSAGYELFDKLGALGLTSFMQEVTRVRALEGELARTIQNIKGVKAARVHLVLPDAGALRSRKQSPAASVVIRTDLANDATAASAIKHLVAAAIPEMVSDQVTVIGTDGSVLSAGGDGSREASSKLVELERSMARQLQDNIRRTLAPYLGVDHFEVSANVRLNADKRQVSETTFDPLKRVERSTRIVKETQNSQENAGAAAVSVAQNIPNEQAGSSGGDQTKRAQDRKEETTNYEIDTKSTSITSDGYRVENVSAAIVINKKRLAEAFGKELTDADLGTQIAEIEKLAQSAIGFDAQRGDRINVSAVNFVADSMLQPSSSDGGWIMSAMSLSGVLIKSLTILAISAIVVFAGFRPALKAVLDRSISHAPVAALAAPVSAMTNAVEAFDRSAIGSALAAPGSTPFSDDRTMFGSNDVVRRPAAGPKDRLDLILSQDEEQATAVLRDWVRNG